MSHHTHSEPMATPSHMSAMDYAEHEKTYRNFLRILKWVIIAHVIVLPLMAWWFMG